MKRCFSPIFVLSAMLPVLCSCTCFRALKWGMADALDAGRFVQDTVSRGGAAFRFVEQPANKRVLDTLHIVYRHGRAFTLGEWMRQTRGGSALLVLHGDDNTSDVGVLSAEEFMPSTSSIPETPIVQSTLYSDANDGVTIAGRGEAIVQTTSAYMSPQYRDRARIYVNRRRGGFPQL